jgi:small-conductance mechanosensitive channel
VVSTLPGSDRPVVRYRVRLHDNHVPPAARTVPRDRADESPTDRPKRRVLAETPITAWTLLLVTAVLVGYLTVMVAAFGIAAGALVVCFGVVVLVATRGRGPR